MPLGILFWVCYLVALIFGFWSSYAPGQPVNWRPFGAYGVLWLLVGILGWAVFGAAVK